MFAVDLNFHQRSNGRTTKLEDVACCQFNARSGTSWLTPYLTRVQSFGAYFKSLEYDISLSRFESGIVKHTIYRFVRVCLLSPVICEHVHCKAGIL